MTRRAERLGGLLLALILAAAAVTYARSLDTAANFDEGGYTAALDAIRHGQQLGVQVPLVEVAGRG